MSNKTYFQSIPVLQNFRTGPYYVYDGSDIVLRFDRDENLRNRYLHGPAVDQILAEEQYTSSGNPTEDPGATYWAATDHLGSVRQLIDNNSAEARRASYDVWGRPGTVTGVGTIYGYTGREYDAETRFQYNRARYYDSVSHRWLSEDPLGLGPDENPYRYVHNQPTNYTDPSGMIEWGHVQGFLEGYVEALGPLGDPFWGIKQVENGIALIQDPLAPWRHVEESADMAVAAGLGNPTEVTDVMEGTLVGGAHLLTLDELYYACEGREIVSDGKGGFEVRPLTPHERGRKTVQGAIPWGALGGGMLAGPGILGRARPRGAASAPKAAPTAPAKPPATAPAKPPATAAPSKGPLKNRMGDPDAAAAKARGDSAYGKPVPGAAGAQSGSAAASGSNYLPGRYSGSASNHGAYQSSGGRVFPTRRNSGLSGKALRDEQAAFTRRRLGEGADIGEIRGQAAEAGLERRKPFGGPDHLADPGAEAAIQRGIGAFNGM